MGVREYDPALGRFVSADPLRGDAINPQARNRYTYVGNNPINRYDLDGKTWYEPWTWFDDDSTNNQNQDDYEEKYADKYTGYRDSAGCRVGFTMNDESYELTGFRYQYLHYNNKYLIRVPNGHSFEVSPENPYLGAFISDLQRYQDMINVAGIGGIINVIEALDPYSWLQTLMDSHEISQEAKEMIEENTLRLYRDYNQATLWEKSCSGPHIIYAD
jgi:hypothetical protein